MKIAIQYCNLIIFFTLILFSCKPRNISADKPRAYDLPLSEGRKSTVINMPISISAIVSQNWAANFYKGLLYSDTTLLDHKLKLNLYADGKPIIHFQNQAIQVELPLKADLLFNYEIDIFGFKTSYKSPLVLIGMVNLETVITAMPDWRIKTQTQFKGIKWQTSPSITLGPISLEVTPILDLYLKNNSKILLTALDQYLYEKIDFKIYADQVWQAIQKPLLINPTYKAWLVMSPQEIKLSPFDIQNENMRFYASLKTLTDVTMGHKPENNTSYALPLLKIEPIKDSSFEVNSLSRVTQEEVKKWVSQPLKGKTFSFPKSNKTVVLDSIDLYGSGENMVITTWLSGSLNAKVYLKGKPYIDSKENSLKVKDLKLDVSSKNMLVNVASWFTEDKIVKKIESDFSYPFQSTLNDLKAQASQSLSGFSLHPNLKLDCKVDSIGVLNIQPSSGYFYAQLLSKGKIKMEVKFP